MRPVSNEGDLSGSAEVIPCDRVESHAKHDSPSMLMAWRSAPPNACRKCELGEQLEVERRTFSKICDRSRERNRLPLATTVADLRCHSQCAVQLFPEGSRSTRTHHVLSHTHKTTMLLKQNSTRIIPCTIRGTILQYRYRLDGTCAIPTA